MNWKKVKLGDVLKHRDERFKPNDKEIEGLERVEKIDFSGNIFLSNKPSKTDMIVVKPGDLLISGINVEKGAMCVYEGTEDVVATIHYSSYQFEETDIDLGFLKCYLKSAAFKQALKEQVPGGIKTEIKPKHLLPLLIEMPATIAEQQEFVALFGGQESKNILLQEELTHQLSLLKQMRQSFLQEAVQGLLVPQLAGEEPATVLLQKIKAEKEKLIAEKKLKAGKPLPPVKEEEVPFDLPAGWVWCRLGDIAAIGTGATPLTSEPEYYADGNVAWITSSATNNLFIYEAEKFITQKALLETNCKVYPVGTLVIAMYGQGKTRGQISELMIEAATNQACATIEVLLPEDALKDYVKRFFQKIYREIRKLAQGGAQPNLNMDKIKTTLISLPPLSEQQRIVEKLESLLALCDALETCVLESRETAKQLLQTALREALSPPAEKEVRGQAALF